MATASVASFEEFFRSEHLRLFRALVVITGNRPEAEDIAQDAFVRIWERWDLVGEMENPVGYLHRTAMNAFRDRRRRIVLSMRRGLRPTPPADPIEAVEARSVATHVLGSLTPRQRAAIVLTEALGYTAEQAGDLLSVKGSTIRALRYQARAALKGSSEKIDG